MLVLLSLTIFWKLKRLLTIFWFILEGSFGDEIGGLLVSQAQCEETFESTNCIDSVHMEPLNSEMFESGQ